MTLLWLFLSPLVVVAVITVIGARLPKTHSAASRICLKAPPEEVWRVITDFPSYPAWRPGLTAVELGPHIDGLPSWFEVCGKKIKVHFRVVASEPPRRLVTRLVDSGLPLSGAWVYELRPANGGTELSITEQDKIYSPFLRFFTRFVIAYHGVMDVFLIALARALGEDVAPEHLSLRVEAGG
ncbi:MAG: SRPBCC family protein [Methylotetracoccus sp.]|nr:SRPBCC family protein [Methylotetracoccus sp.]